MKSIINFRSEKRPFSVTFTLALLIFLAAIWLAFGFFAAWGGNASLINTGIFRWLMAAASIVAGLVLLGLTYLLSIHFKPAWYFSVAMLAAMVLAGFLDDVGWADILYMVFAVIPLCFLIKDRKWYLKRQL